MALFSRAPKVLHSESWFGGVKSKMFSFSREQHPSDTDGVGGREGCKRVLNSGMEKKQKKRHFFSPWGGGALAHSKQLHPQTSGKLLGFGAGSKTRVWHMAPAQRMQIQSVSLGWCRLHWARTPSVSYDRVPAGGCACCWLGHGCKLSQTRDREPGTGGQLDLDQTVADG